MKIVVIGGTGLIGAKTVALLNQRGHDVIAASPGTGVNALTGEGLDIALNSADVVVDVANSPSFEDDAVMAFFTRAGANLRGAIERAGVKHHVVLSVVGTSNLLESGYFRAKQAQEDMVRAGKTPFTVVHSTQFFEFLAGIAAAGFDGQSVRLSNAGIQQITSGDVAGFVADIALSAPANGTLEIAGPQVFGMCDLIESHMVAINDPRPVICDADAPYFGVRLSQNSLLPQSTALLGATPYHEWLSRFVSLKTA